MQTNFEKQVQKRLHDLRIAPSRHVWNDIADALSVPKKRRIAAWWFIAAGSVILGTGLWMAGNKLLTSDKNNLAVNNKVVLTHSISQNLNQLITSSAGNSTFYNIDNAKGTKAETSNSFDLNSTQKEIAEVNENKSLNNMQLFSRGNGDAYMPKTLQQKPVVTLGSPINNNQTQVLPNNLFTSSNDDKIKSDILENKKEMPALQNNSSSSDVAASTQKIKSNKKSAWSFLFDGGTTNTTNNNAFFKKSNPLIYHNGTASDTLKSMKPAYPGFHAGVGIQYSLALSRRWSFYSGLQVSFLLNHQRTGTEVREESEISNATDTLSSNQKYVQIPYHYVDGVSTNLTNYATWLEVPVGFGYKIIPRGKVKVELRGGGSVAHMSTDKWLIPDGRYDKFYYCNPLTNNYIVNIHEDIVVTLPNHKIIGLQYQHSLSGLAKKEVEPALYWSNISLYTTIPLK